MNFSYFVAFIKAGTPWCVLGGLGVVAGRLQKKEDIRVCITVLS